MADKLKYALLGQGSKFVVSDEVKDSKFMPGTTGFISYYSWSDLSYVRNFVDCNCIVTKRGKKGIDRLVFTKITVPIVKFDLKQMNMMSAGGDYLDQKKCYAHINDVPVTTLDVMEMPSLDFLAWAMAKGRYLLHTTHASSSGIRAWGDICAKHNAIERINHFDKSYSLHPLTTMADSANTEARVTFVDLLRIVEAKLTVACIKEHYSSAVHTARTVKRIRQLSRKGMITARGVVNLEKEREQVLKDVRERMECVGKNVAKK